MVKQPTSWVTVLVLVACACSGAGSGDDVIVRDSAGVRIVDVSVHALHRLENWAVATDAAVAIGVLEGNPAYEFSRISDAALLPDGQIVVVDVLANEIRRFSSSGSHVHTVGGKGEAPGEFRSVDWIKFVSSDSLFVWDSRLDRLSVFDRSGALITTRRVDLPGRPFPAFVWEMLTDQSLLVLLIQIASRDRGRVVRDSTIVARFDPAQPERLDTLGIKGLQPVLPFDGREELVPFTIGPLLGPDSTAVWLGNGSSGTLERFANDGRLQAIIRISLPQQQVSEEHRQQARSARLRAVRTNADSQSVDRAYRQMPWPGALPVFDRLHSDQSGRLWLRQYVLPDDTSQHWIVLEPTGRPLGRVVLPAELELLDIGANAVLGRWIDHLDVQSVRVYKFGT